MSGSLTPYRVPGSHIYYLNTACRGKRAGVHRRLVRASTIRRDLTVQELSTTVMQRVFRLRCRKHLSRQCACWLAGVLLLLAIITYRMATDIDEMTVGVDIDSHHESNDEIAAITSDDEKYVPAASDADIVRGNVKRNLRTGRQQDNEGDRVHKEHDDGRDRGKDELQRGGRNDDDDEYNGERRGPAADDEGNDTDAADRKKQRGGEEKQHPRLRGTDDNNKVEANGVDSDGGSRKDVDDDANAGAFGKDADDVDHKGKNVNEVDNAGRAEDDGGNGRDAANRNKQHGEEDDHHARGRAADDENKVGDGGVGGDSGLGKDAGEDAAGGDADDETNVDTIDGSDAVNNDTGKSYNTCDAECEEFRRQLASWPPDKPKAFIYYLIHRPAMRSLRKSIRTLHRNFNNRFRYPIVVFVEPNLDTIADRRRIADMVPANSKSSPPPSIYVQVVRFRIPDYVNASLVPRMAGFGLRKRTIGYRHMCRFHAGGVYEQPIVRSPGLEYGWRLDDDSVIQRPIDYDLFRVMRDGRYQYGYRKINRGWSPVDYTLWDAVDRYLNVTPSLTPTFYRRWPKNAARYFNNFEVSDLRVWLSPQYRDYFNFVDRLGGIYYHKWGDAAIKTIAVTLFIPRDRTHRFTGIAYSHT